MTPTEHGGAGEQAAREFPEELRGAAAQNPGGWVYAIDPSFDPLGQVPPEGIVGAWTIGPDGVPTAEFTANPNYRGPDAVEESS